MSAFAPESYLKLLQDIVKDCPPDNIRHFHIHENTDEMILRVSFEVIY